MFVDTNLSDLQALREAVSMDQMNRLVDLGYLLGKIVVKPRETLASTGVEDVSAWFTQEENALWYVLDSFSRATAFPVSLRLTHYMSLDSLL